MDDPFFIPVVYKELEQEFEATLQWRAYLPVLNVNVDGAMVIFERDEEGQWRAVVPQDEKGKVPDVQLLQAIAEAIEELLK